MGQAPEAEEEAQRIGAEVLSWLRSQGADQSQIDEVLRGLGLRLEGDVVKPLTEAVGGLTTAVSTADDGVQQLIKDVASGKVSIEDFLRLIQEGKVSADDIIQAAQDGLINVESAKLFLTQLPGELSKAQKAAIDELKPNIANEFSRIRLEIQSELGGVLTDLAAFKREFVRLTQIEVDNIIAGAEVAGEGDFFDRWLRDVGAAGQARRLVDAAARGENPGDVNRVFLSGVTRGHDDGPAASVD